MKTEEKGNNGNGNGSKGSIPAAEGRKFGKEDMPELCVLVAYIVQQAGLANQDDVKRTITKQLDSKVHPATLKKALEALRFKDILAMNYEGGMPHYKMRKLKFNCNVEIAHVTRLLTALLDDAAGMAIKSQIEQYLGAGEDGNRGKSQGYPKGPYALYTLKLKLLQKWYGPYPLEESPARQSEYEKTDFKAHGNVGTPYHVFQRTFDGKKLSIHTGCVRGFFKNHLGKLGMGPNAIRYFDFEPIEHRPQLPLKVMTNRLPVQRADAAKAGESTGAGFIYYETLMPGEVITVQFTAPTVNFVTPKELENWLRHVLRFCTRSMSPARGSQTGKSELVSLEHELLFFTEQQKVDYDKQQAKEAREAQTAS
jgi:hypothetical protein